MIPRRSIHEAAQIYMENERRSIMERTKDCAETTISKTLVIERPRHLPLDKPASTGKVEEQLIGVASNERIPQVSMWWRSKNCPMRGIKDSCQAQACALFKLTGKHWKTDEPMGICTL